MGIMDEKRQRYDFIDLLKGFGIFLVVWGHTMTPRSTYIYSFHMPLFFFLSGFIHKDKPLRSFIAGKIGSLYIPYLTFSLFSWLFYLVPLFWRGNAHRIGVHLSHLDSLLTGSAENGGNNPIWFLACILAVSVIYAVLNRFIGSSWIKTCIIGGLSGLGYYLSLIQMDLPFQISIALSGLVFYGLGHWIKQRDVLQRVDSFQPYQLVGFLLLMELLHIYTAHLNAEVAAIHRVNMAGNLIGNYFLFYLSAFAGIGFYLVLGYKLRYVRLFNYLGVHTLIILGVHKPFLQILDGLFPAAGHMGMHLYGLLTGIAAILLSLVIGHLVNKKAPYLLGKNVAFGQWFVKTAS